MLNKSKNLLERQKRKQSLEEYEYSDSQWRENVKIVIPYKAISLALILLILGTACIILGSLLKMGIISNKYNDRMWPLLIVGIIMWIPGAYHVYLAFKAYTHQKGYSYQDIPDFN